MKAGRELDALMAEHVMELVPGRDFDYPTKDPPRYSTDISAAWEVIDHCLKKLNLNPNVFVHANKEDDDQVNIWTCSLMDSSANYISENKRTWKHYEAEGETGPHVICLAALKAVGVEV